jgi:hypothetical protein
MSKKYKNKTCVYCGAKTSTTGDHIIARQFISVEKRSHLPQVPTCEECNNAKSALENYLTTVLPFGSRAPGAIEMLSSMVPPRLENNFRLKQSIQVGAREVWVKSVESGIIQRSMTIPFQGEQFLALLRMIIKGLVFYHWESIMPQNYIVQAFSLTLEGLISFRDKIEPNFLQKNSVRGNIGDGCFLYTGAKHHQDPATSVWEMDFYNVQLTGPGQKIPGSLYFCGVSGPRPIN